MASETNNFAECLYFASGVLSRRLNKMAEDAFGRIGLSPSHAFLLMLVNQRPGIQPSEISKVLRLTPSTITRLIEKMERRGYLRRTPAGRVTHVEPVPGSLELEQDLRRCWDELQEAYRSLLGGRYTDVLTEMTYTATDKLVR